MAEIKSLFTGEEHAALYKKYRLSMKTQTVQKIIDFLAQKFNPSECDAVDVGCGSGQGTLPLAPFLRHIVGVDPSENQIIQGKSDPHLPANVEFRVGQAENLPIKDSSVHLVFVKSALHWFDIPKFFQEVDRVLKPGGVLAVNVILILHDVPGHEDEVADLFSTLAAEYRPPEIEERRNLYITGFKDVKFPFDECIRDQWLQDVPDITVRYVMNNVRTRSDVVQFIKEKPEEAENALKATEEKLMEILGATGSPEETIVVKHSRQTLILCRKP